MISGDSSFGVRNLQVDIGEDDDRVNTEAWKGEITSRNGFETLQPRAVRHSNNCTFITP